MTWQLNKYASRKLANLLLKWNFVRVDIATVLRTTNVLHPLSTQCLGTFQLHTHTYTHARHSLNIYTASHE